MLTVLTLEKSEEWDRIVRTFSNYDVYYLSGYVKAFEIHGDGIPLLFYYDNERNILRTRGINVVMKRDIAKAPCFRGILEQEKLFDFSSPYGYGGWLIEGEESEQLFIDYERWCKKNNVVSEFVRFHPLLENHKQCERVYDIVPLGETVVMDLDSPEVIWENITSKNRNVIRKAIRSGVKIYNGRYPEIYKQFREIYNATMDKDDADKYYYFEPEFYSSILEDLSQESQVFYAQIPDGTIIAASVMLATNQKMNYHLSGFVKEYASLAATNLLLYKAALWGWANKYQTLYLGGGVGSREDNLFKFKKAFHKEAFKRFYIGKKIFIPKEYEELVCKRADDKRQNFFPAYRG